MFCQDPGEVAGATRDVTRGPYPVGTVIRYGCIIGVGETITCQTKGQWTQKPMCTDAGTGMNCNFVSSESSNSRISWDIILGFGSFIHRIDNICIRGFICQSKNNQQENVTSSEHRTGDFCHFCLMLIHLS